MNITIAKLNKLNNPESFIQIDMVKGFKYIDKAGEIVNSYHKENVSPQFVMDLNGLIIEKPKDKIDQLKVTPLVIWEKFSKVDSLDMISNLFSKDADAILKILEVDKISRVGWRNYFIYEFDSKERQDEYLKKFTVIDNTQPTLIGLEIKTGKSFFANLMIRPVVKNDAAKTPGILFDIDIYQKGEFESNRILELLNEFRHYLIATDGYLSVVNNTFQ